MKYHVVIEGLDNTWSVRESSMPLRGDWLNLKWENKFWWFPVLDVAHVLTNGGETEDTANEGDGGDGAAGVVVSSAAMGIVADARDETDSFKLILPPSRWPRENGSAQRSVG